jgi:hypothetical protein
MRENGCFFPAPVRVVFSNTCKILPVLQKNTLERTKAVDCVLALGAQACLFGINGADANSFVSTLVSLGEK